MKAILAIFMAVALTGCFGEPTLDATDMESVKVSLQEMTESMTESEHEDFRKDIFVIGFGGPEGLKKMLQSAFQGETKDGSDYAIENMRKADGMTVQEMKAFANELRNQ